MRHLLTALINLVFPAHCLICHRRAEGLCATCAFRLPKLEPTCWRCGVPTAAGQTCARCRPRSALETTISLAPFDDGRVSRLVHALKYEGVTEMLTPWLETRDDVLEQVADLHAAIVPVPLHRRRRRSRGYDQAELIARVLATLTDSPLVPALVRQRPTRDQTELDAAERRLNLASAFRRADVTIPRPTVLLVDDVLTTGATIEAAAQPLRKAGVRRIVALTLARTKRKIYER